MRSYWVANGCLFICIQSRDWHTSADLSSGERGLQPCTMHTYEPNIDLTCTEFPYETCTRPCGYLVRRVEQELAAFSAGGCYHDYNAEYKSLSTTTTHSRGH